MDGAYVKQDADDFIKFQGPDAFERLLSGSENGVEFRMAQVAGKYDLQNDEARVAYCEEISTLLASLPSAVEREIYTTRAAEVARITPEAMKLEVQRAFRRQAAREKRAQTRKDLNPAAALQPQERSLRYENLRSARAEEGIIRLFLLDESLFPPGSAPDSGAVLFPVAGPRVQPLVAGAKGWTAAFPGGIGRIPKPGGDEPHHLGMSASGIGPECLAGPFRLHTHHPFGS